MPPGEKKNDWSPPQVPVTSLPWAPGTVDPKKIKYLEGGKLRKLDTEFTIAEGRTFKDTRAGDYILRTYTDADGKKTFATVGYYQQGDLKMFDANGRLIKAPSTSYKPNWTGKNDRPTPPPKYQQGWRLESDPYYVTGDKLATSAGLNQPPPAAARMRLHSSQSEGTTFLPTILGSPIGQPGRKASKPGTVLG